MGTVINTQQLQEVTEAGSQFVISPGITEPLLKAALEGQMPLIPGISTVFELMIGVYYGLREFKFFPAEANGGVKALQAIGGPFPQVRFCPTDGIKKIPHAMTLHGEMRVDELLLAAQRQARKLRGAGLPSRRK